MIGFVGVIDRLFALCNSHEMKNKKAEASPSEEFFRLAQAKWGRPWRTKVAEALSVHPTTVWRWMQEGGEPPLAALLALRSMCRRKVDASAAAK